MGGLRVWCQWATELACKGEKQQTNKQTKYSTPVNLHTTPLTRRLTRKQTHTARELKQHICVFINAPWWRETHVERAGTFACCQLHLLAVSTRACRHPAALARQARGFALGHPRRHRPRMMGSMLSVPRSPSLRDAQHTDDDAGAGGGAARSDSLPVRARPAVDVDVDVDVDVGATSAPLERMDSCASYESLPAQGLRDLLPSFERADPDTDSAGDTEADNVSCATTVPSSGDVCAEPAPWRHHHTVERAGAGAETSPQLSQRAPSSQTESEAGVVVLTRVSSVATREATSPRRRAETEAEPPSTALSRVASVESTLNRAAVASQLRRDPSIADAQPSQRLVRCGNQQRITDALLQLGVELECPIWCALVCLCACVCLCDYVRVPLTCLDRALTPVCASLSTMYNPHNLRCTHAFCRYVVPCRIYIHPLHWESMLLCVVAGGRAMSVCVLVVGDSERAAHCGSVVWCTATALCGVWKRPQSAPFATHLPIVVMSHPTAWYACVRTAHCEPRPASC